MKKGLLTSVAMKALRFGIVEVGVDGSSQIRHTETVFTPWKDWIKLRDLGVLNPHVCKCRTDTFVALLIS